MILVAAGFPYRMAEFLHRVIGEEADVEDGAGHVVVRLGDRLAHVAGVGHRELVGVLLHEISEAMHELLALVESHAGPWALVEGGAGGGDGAVRVGLTAAGNGRPLLPGVGIDIRHRGAVERGNLLAADDVTEELHGRPPVRGGKSSHAREVPSQCPVPRVRTPRTGQ